MSPAAQLISAKTLWYFTRLSLKNSQTDNENYYVRRTLFYEGFLFTEKAKLGGTTSMFWRWAVLAELSTLGQ